MSLLGYPERDVWRMTPYKLMALFHEHQLYDERRKGFISEPERPDDWAEIDDALGGF